MVRVSARERFPWHEPTPAGPRGPDPETNGMQGYGIPFCGHCGRDLDAQKIRRGEPKRFCSDACRARAWRRRAVTGAGSDMNADDPSASREVIGGGW